MLLCRSEKSNFNYATIFSYTPYDMLEFEILAIA